MVFATQLSYQNFTTTETEIFKKTQCYFSSANSDQVVSWQIFRLSTRKFEFKPRRNHFSNKDW